MAARKHKDVEFVVERGGRSSQYFETFNEAAGMAVTQAFSDGRPATIDILVHSRAGAKWLGGDDAVEIYNEDPEASVFERIVVSADSHGRIA